MTQDLSAVLADLAPQGRLRAALNHGNPVLVQRDRGGGEPRGVSPDLARELARRLGVPVEFVHFDTAGKVFEAIAAQAWDVAFLAIDAARAIGIDFTAPYVIIEGTYLIRQDAAEQKTADLDRPGVRIAVGLNAAYDLYLTRALKHAELVRAPTSAAAMEWFVERGLDASAGVRQPLQAFAREHQGLRVLGDSFMRIEQAMGVPKGRAAGAHYIRSFLEEMKASGFVARALAASGQKEVTIAPAST